MPKRRLSSSGRAPRVCIVVSRYNSSITDRLMEGASAAFRRRQPEGQLEVFEAPGAFELPAIAHAAAAQGRFDGVLAIGCIIKGETRHDEYIAHAVANGLVNASLRTGIPIAFGVLTVDTIIQAEERAGGRHGNKGGQSMEALLDTIQTMRSLAAPRPFGEAGSDGKLAPTSAPDKVVAARRRSRVGGKS